MIHFASDNHFGHANIIKFCKRPFDTVEEMDEEMIARWNEVVTVGDTVYYVGDFCLGGYDQWQRYRNRLNGKILFVPSDHDHRWVKCVIGACGITPLWILQPLYVLRLGKRVSELTKGMPTDLHDIVLCHWMMRSWPRSHYGTWHIHGHHHRRAHLEFPGKVLNVAVDLHDFYPWSLDEVVAYMARQPNNTDYIGDRKK